MMLLSQSNRATVFHEFRYLQDQQSRKAHFGSQLHMLVSEVQALFLRHSF